MKTAPDVAIIDYSLPILNGVEVTRQIRQRSPGTEVIIFTMHDNNNLIHDLLQAGALGYLLKSDAKRLLLTAVETVARAQAVLHRNGLRDVAAVLPDQGQ